MTMETLTTTSQWQKIKIYLVFFVGIMLLLGFTPQVFAKPAISIDQCRNGGVGTHRTAMCRQQMAKR